MRVKITGKVIPTSFLKTEGRGTICWGGRPEKEEQLVELVGDQSPSFESSRGERAKEMSGMERWRRERLSLRGGGGANG